MLAHLKENINLIDNNDDDADGAGMEESLSSALYSDKRRRKLLLAAPTSTLAFLLNKNAASSASAELDVTMSTNVDTLENLSLSPQPPPQQINTAISMQKSSSSRLMCADSEEENRIAIFERVAPSVVYIDTFVEKQDVFSTNV